jgi:hypothetical protein
MSRRITIVGLAALCALAFGAISASGASAAGATAYTCVAGGGGANTNADCQPGSSGTSGHVAIAANTPTTLILNSLSEQKLATKIFGATVELIATGVECVECTGENKEPTAGNMEVVGKGGHLRYTGVRVAGTQGENCTVFEDKPNAEEGLQGVITTTPLKVSATSPTAATIAPETGTELAHFIIETKSGTHPAVCNITGTFTVSGTAPVTLNGAVVTANVTKASGFLTVAGEPASLKGEATAEAGEGATHHPIALTAS